jgi:periplasmic protein TonB
MSKVNVFDHGWIDLVFEGRNQSYGAYQLRKQDSKTTLLALVTGIGIVVSLISIPAIINKFSTNTVVIDPVVKLPETTIIEFEAYQLPQTPEPKPAAQQPAAAAAQSVVPTVTFTPLEATSQPVTTTVTTVQLATSIPGTVTTAGTGTSISFTPGTGTSETGVSTTGTGTAGTIETMVDVAPLYPGGLDKFYQDVANRFRVPEIANATSIRVFVSFVVEPDGTLSNIKSRDPGHGLGAEAIRVLKSLKAVWKPGMKGGKAVRTAYSLPITVKVN